MNNFDLMIEKYRKELMQAKKRSIIKEIEEVAKETEEIVQAEKSIEEEIVSVIAEPQDEYPMEDEPQDEEPAQEETAEEEPDVPTETPDQKTEKMSDNIFEEPDVNNPGVLTGTLKIQIFAADQVYPVQSAHVTVKDSETGEVIFEGYSNSSGIVDGISLATPSSQISQSPFGGLSYSEVDILIKHPRFVTVKYIKVPIFSGVESIQTVQLIPTAEGNEEEITITQSEPKNLESAGE